MTKQELIEQVKEVLSGIDQEETENDEGWWGTPDGAEFGESKLKEVITLIEKLDH